MSYTPSNSNLGYFANMQTGANRDIINTYGANPSTALSGLVGNNYKQQTQLGDYLTKFREQE
jgi:hypothetical protein